MDDVTQGVIDSLSGWSVDNVPNLVLRVILAILLIVVGRLVAKWIVRWFHLALVRAKVDETLLNFFDKLIYFLLLAMLLIWALNLLGFQTTSIIAILGAFALAIGLALQDTLSNFASGILIIMLRPYQVNHFVELSNELGYVDEIRFFHTVLRTRDNKILFIPNSDVMDNNIINYSEMEWIRLDLTFGIAYGDDLLKAKDILTEIVTADTRIAKDPAPVIAVRDLSDSSVDFAVRPYVKEHNMVPVKFDLVEQVKLRFDEENINIPFPQRDVHLIQA